MDLAALENPLAAAASPPWRWITAALPPRSSPAVGRLRPSHGEHRSSTSSSSTARKRNNARASLLVLLLLRVGEAMLLDYLLLWLWVLWENGMNSGKKNWSWCLAGNLLLQMLELVVGQR